jgi:hypothetical protein
MGSGDYGFFHAKTRQTRIVPPMFSEEDSSKLPLRDEVPTRFKYTSLRLPCGYAESRCPAAPGELPLTRITASA